TRLSRDWSSDVCSSDLHTRYLLREALPLGAGFVIRRTNLHVSTILLTVLAGSATVGLYNSAYRFLQMVEVGALTLSSVLFPVFRSEERRVGKECGSRRR